MLPGFLDYGVDIVEISLLSPIAIVRFALMPQHRPDARSPNIMIQSRADGSVGHQKRAGRATGVLTLRRKAKHLTIGSTVGCTQKQNRHIEPTRQAVAQHGPHMQRVEGGHPAIGVGVAKDKGQIGFGQVVLIPIYHRYPVVGSTRIG